eukprot:g16790.t1
MQTAMSKRTNGFLQSRLLNQASYIARARQMFDFGQQKPDLSTITERKVYENHASFPVYWKQIIPAISAAIKSGARLEASLCMLAVAALN